MAHFDAHEGGCGLSNARVLRAERIENRKLWGNIVDSLMLTLHGKGGFTSSAVQRPRIYCTAELVSYIGHWARSEFKGALCNSLYSHVPMGSYSP
jgi:hypothetical protein